MTARECDCNVLSIYTVINCVLRFCFWHVNWLCLHAHSFLVFDAFNYYVSLYFADDMILRTQLVGVQSVRFGSFCVIGTRNTKSDIPIQPWRYRYVRTQGRI